MPLSIASISGLVHRRENQSRSAERWLLQWHGHNIRYCVESAGMCCKNVWYLFIFSFFVILFASCIICAYTRNDQRSAPWKHITFIIITMAHSYTSCLLARTTYVILSYTHSIWATLTLLPVSDGRTDGHTKILRKNSVSLAFERHIDTTTTSILVFIFLSVCCWPIRYFWFVNDAQCPLSSQQLNGHKIKCIKYQFANTSRI